MGEVTVLLQRLNEGDRAAMDALMQLVYRELRAVARKHLRGEPSDHTFTPSDLVHEVFLKLVDQRDAHWQNRAQFFAVAATAMRRILISHARRRVVRRRFARRVMVTFVTGSGEHTATPEELLALDTALEHLATIHERRCSVVQLSFFGGLTQREIAAVLGVSVPTVKKDWRIARAWLSRELRAA